VREKEKHWCPEYVTTSFVAEHCGVSSVTVLSWIDEKRLPAFRLLKGHYRIRRDDFLKFLVEYKMNISHEENDDKTRRYR
jgi:excisionase family DNA binding protein